MKNLLLCTILFSFSCSTTSPYLPTVPNRITKRVESRELPPKPSEESLPSDIPKGNWSESVEKNKCVDKSGILISEEKAYRINLYKIRYDELRSTYESDRLVWSTHRELYEERLNLASKAIERLQPSWWDKNKFSLGVVGGIVTGIATSVAIFYATDQISN